MNNNNEEAQIQQKLDSWKAAFEAGDAERLMSFYSPEIVAFDIMPPLQFVGEDEWRNNWTGFLKQFEGNPTLETRNMTITCSAEVAFVRCLMRIKGKMNGQQMDVWTRVTNCFRKIDDNWLIVHDHVSVPVDFSADKPCLGLKPR